MYEVLGISMEIAGHPQEEIDRVMLSQIDFTAADVPSMIFSGAYLTRFGGDAAAMRIYRQASRLNPERAEPYVLGLKLARKLGDHAAIEWAAAGILTYDFTENYELHHKEAEQAIAETCQSLVKDGKREEAARMRAKVEQAKVRDLILQLSWSGNGDIDMIVEEPSGSVCSFANARSAGGGVFLHDGFGPRAENCFEHYVCVFGMPGDYRVRIRHIDGNIVGKRAVLRMTRYAGTPEESVTSVTIPLGKSLKFSLHRGRRQKAASVSESSRTIHQLSSQLSGAIQTRARGMRAGTRPASRDFLRDRRRLAPRRAAGPNTGFQPVVTVIPEGITMQASAVVSADRRYVRMTLAPTFSNIVDVFTFTFAGPAAGTAAGGAAQGLAGGGLGAGAQGGAGN